MKVLSLVAVAMFTVACGNDATTRPKIVDDIDAVTGTSAKALRSQLHRSRGTTVLTAEGETTAANNLPNGYVEIPRLDEGDDGRGADTQVVYAVRPKVECGLGAGLVVVKDRLRDCAQKNPQHYQWKGTANGNAGEGDWKLVALDATGREIWLDDSTGFLWSDAVTAATDWCKAAGNGESPVGSGTIDCNTLGAGSSICVGKSLLNIPASEVAWRLPTRGDFLQADLNGARFVLRNTNLNVWTATVNGSNREQAWSIVMSTGALNVANRDASAGARCIGRILK